MRHTPSADAAVTRRAWTLQGGTRPLPVNQPAHGIAGRRDNCPMAELTPEYVARINAAGSADPAVQAAIDAVAAAVENLAGEYAAAAPEAYTGSASWTVAIDRVDDEPEKLTYLSDAAANGAGYPEARRQ